MKISDQARDDLGEAYAEHPGIAVARRIADAGRVGEKSAVGFYDHAAPPATLWMGLGELFPAAAKQPGLAEVQERLMYGQGVEAMRCFAEGIVTRAQDADVASILGWGFPPFTGGVASWVRRIGEARFAANASALATRHGPRFAPPEPMPAL